MIVRYLLRRRLWSLLLVAALGLGAVGMGPATAVSSSRWQAGYIISDQQFYNSASMTPAQVQAFLNGKYQGCASGYTCLRDYTQGTSDRTDSNGYCSPYSGNVNGETAATIIWKVAQACGINPQVILVTLQKEEGLVTATAPPAYAYQSAMGYGCPDSTPGVCDANYYGFYNQVWWASRQFRVYQHNAANYSYQAGRSNYIQYNPNTGCGGSNVYIANQATAGLYNYTPYQPDAAVLAGSSDSCSTFGNWNFWQFFNNWFGNSQYSFSGFETSFSSPGNGADAIGNAQLPAIATGQPLSANSHPAIAATTTGTVTAFSGGNGHLWLTGTLGTLDTGQPVAANTSPSLAASPKGGFRVAFQLNGAWLAYYDVPAGTLNGTASSPWLGMLAGASPSIAALPGGGYETAFDVNNGTLGVWGDGGTSFTGMGMAQNSDPAIAASPNGGWKVAFQANTATLWTFGSVVPASNTWLGMAPSTSPSITAYGSGYQVAFQSNANELWVWGDGGMADSYLGMLAGSSPAITTIGSTWVTYMEANTRALYRYPQSNDSGPVGPAITGATSPAAVGVGGGVHIAFKGSTGLSLVSTGAAAAPVAAALASGTNVNVAMLADNSPAFSYQATGGGLAVQTNGGLDVPGLGMMAGTSPAIAGSASTGYKIAFQANTGQLWTYAGGGTAAAVSGAVAMAPGSSPSITRLASGGYEMAYRGSDGNLYVTGDAGSVATSLGISANTSPAIAASNAGGYEVAFNSGTLWLYSSSFGAGSPGLGMMAGTSPGIAALLGAGYEAAFQANTGALWAYGDAGTANYGMGMATGTSPTIAGRIDNGWRIAFTANTDTLWFFDTSLGAWNTGAQAWTNGRPCVASALGGCG